MFDDFFVIIDATLKTANRWLLVALLRTIANNPIRFPFHILCRTMNTGCQFFGVLSKCLLVFVLLGLILAAPTGIS